jgi:hypothetical protein
VVLPGEQHLGGRAGLHGQLGSHGNGVSEANGPFGGGNADTPVALAAEDLGAFAGGIAELHEDRPGGGDQPVLAGGGRQLNEPAAEDKAALDIAAHQAWWTSASARLCTVGRASPVAATSCARVVGPASSASSTCAALSMTPTPLELSMY